VAQQPLVAIIGAGAMGCLFGALLARAGVEVLLVDVDRRLVELIGRDGVTVVRDGNEQVTRVPATADPVQHEPVAAAIVLVKGYHTAEAAAFARALVGPATVVASLQNGWGNEGALAAELGDRRVLAGVTYHSATTRGPATVAHNASGPTYLGPWGSAALDDCAVLARAFQEAGLDCIVTADVLTEVWKKLVFNAAGLAVGALTGLDPRGVAANREVRELVFGLAREAVAAADAAGFDLDADERVATLAAAFEHAAPGTKGSMRQDVEAGRRTEVDTINQAIVEVAARHGLDAPLNRAMVALVKGYEAAHPQAT
jgi:2-dehydropantoate 2-reductase